MQEAQEMEVWSLGLTVVLSGDTGGLDRSPQPCFLRDPGGGVTKVLCVAGGKMASTFDKKPVSLTHMIAFNPHSNPREGLFT